MITNNMLTTIAEKKVEEIKHAKSVLSIDQLKEQSYGKTRDFISPLRQHRPAIIAEIKKGSPSKGIIRADFDVAAIAKDYQNHGAACLSVLTDETFFYGHPTNINIAKANSSLPVLRKDFIIDPYQVYESKYLGADCILLIVAMLSDKQLLELCELAQSLSMAVLVESHDESELKRALTLPTPLMGINNRNLNTFNTDIHTSIRLRKLIPEDRIIISESGIHTRDDIEKLNHEGIHCFLIGESLMRQTEPGTYLHELTRR
ncbi:indole-3-glycerol phosphate synthase TrpC [Legionella sp. W05-934-2]|jgi:indole-3-glycerol phosphate synthase|uniref:indole-3-glycerol phosphate synthase TrpC n=1 Tax=Legionella sp. W05-934-2 TaxID=1198649 RepID=UPI003462698A